MWAWEAPILNFNPHHAAFGKASQNAKYLIYSSVPSILERIAEPAQKCAQNLKTAYISLQWAPALENK